ncbi:MAG: hypothetical protein H6709_10555 [Kofleriaceae bacterium]|nr:hypothetical protein [Myxococcales bacterium]MCB9564117.1 hypothetical protein [Kofleriaceae bacterium]MCB9572515.1 hypothetical protein [Kofleriaceae bacterium]
MHELANDINGDPVEVPEATRFWRLRRHLGGRGASVVVTNDDHSAVLLPVGASYAEFHETVKGAPGKYTLYPCDEHGRPMKGAAVAHVYLGEAPRNANAAAQAGGDAITQLIGLLRETVDANTAMCKEVIGKYAGTLTSNAELIRAVDGAGVPARVPGAVAEAGSDDDDEEVVEREPTLAEVAMKQASDAFLIWMKLRTEGKATESGGAESARVVEDGTSAPGAEAAKGESRAAASSRTAGQKAGAAPGVPSAAQMAHLLAVKAKLEAREARVVETAIGKMSGAERAGWIAELCARSVDEAVVLVRDVLTQSKAAAKAPGGGS